MLEHFAFTSFSYAVRTDYLFSVFHRFSGEGLYKRQIIHEILFTCIYNYLLPTPYTDLHDCIIKKVKGKVFTYSLPSVGPGADPGVQAVSPQVT